MRRLRQAFGIVTKPAVEDLSAACLPGATQQARPAAACAGLVVSADVALRQCLIKERFISRCFGFT
jgi:hypothetical protein